MGMGMGIWDNMGMGMGMRLPLRLPTPVEQLGGLGGVARRWNGGRAHGNYKLPSSRIAYRLAACLCVCAAVRGFLAEISAFCPPPAASPNCCQGCCPPYCLKRPWMAALLPKEAVDGHASPSSQRTPSTHRGAGARAQARCNTHGSCRDCPHRPRAPPAPDKPKSEFEIPAKNPPLVF